jgi:hypothetical protein
MYANLTFFRPNRQNIIIILAIITLSATVSAQEPILVVRVGDVLAPYGTEGVPIPVYMENYADTVVAFELWLILSNPDVFEFQYNAGLKSTPIEFDTTNTLLSGWQFVDARSLTETGHEVKIIGRANTIPPPHVHGIGYPQSGEIPLIKIMADVYDIPPMPVGLTAEILIMADNLDNFNFSDEMGNSIGVIIDTVIDTTCWDCVQWLPPPNDTICLVWEQVPGSTGDSCIVDTILVPTLDTAAVHVYNGSLTVFLCGDINDDEAVNIFDVTELIGTIYLYWPQPDYWEILGDINNDGVVNIFDVTYLISYLYMDGSAPTCNYLWLP